MTLATLLLGATLEPAGLLMWLIVGLVAGFVATGPGVTAWTLVPLEVVVGAPWMPLFGAAVGAPVVPPETEPAVAAVAAAAAPVVAAGALVAAGAAVGAGLEAGLQALTSTAKATTAAARRDR